MLKRIAFVVVMSLVVTGCRREVIVKDKQSVTMAAYKTLTVNLGGHSLKDLDREDQEYFRSRLNSRLSRNGLLAVEAGAPSELTLNIDVDDYGRTNYGMNADVELTCELIENSRRESVGKFVVKTNSRYAHGEPDPLQPGLDKNQSQEVMDHAAIKIAEHLFRD